MNSKKSNWLFLSVIVTHFVVVAGIIYGPKLLKREFSFDMLSDCVVSELIILIPALLFLIFCKGRKNESIGFRRMKISTCFMTVLFAFLCMPLSGVLNAITMFFVDNTVSLIQDDLLAMGLPMVVLMVGIYGPFCEEFVFRGLLYRGYKKSGGALEAVLLSALTFGMMHLNINQALYAFVLGIMFAFLVEATGSLWSSVLCHVVFNSWQVGLMFLGNYIEDTTYIDAGPTVEITTGTLLIALSFYLIVAAITTPLAVCVLAWMAKNEKREEKLRLACKWNNEKKEYLVSIPFVLASVICLAYMSLVLVL